MGKYEYLKKYISYESLNRKCIFNEFMQHNWFGVVSLDEIKESEERLGFDFPSSLKEFWLEIGYGFFGASVNNLITLDYDKAEVNRICSPEQIADILLLTEENGFWDKEEIPFFQLEGPIDFQKGEIPFFHVNSGDCTEFLLMKFNLGKPDAVYRYNLLIEEHFERFIWRLYYESPTFYLDVPDPEYDKWLAEQEAKKQEEEELRKNAPSKGALWGYVSRNYRKWLWEEEVFKELEYGGEPAAERIIDKYKDLIKLNYCPNCGNLKMTPKARQCLKCGQFHDPELV